MSKLSSCQTKLNIIQQSPSGELSDKIFRKCEFCEKFCEIFSSQSFLLQKLAEPEHFYCSFCLRHNFHTKINKNILILSFRSIFGYFYYQNYLNPQEKNKFWLSEIEDFILSHEDAGLINPLFSYDPETMLWFIDFSRVGDSKKKIPIEEILKTIISILVSFNLSHTIIGVNMSLFYQKYKDAIELFYNKRKRPEGKRLLIPTLSGCIIEPRIFSFDKTKNFIFKNL